MGIKEMLPIVLKERERKRKRLKIRKDNFNLIDDELIDDILEHKPYL